VVRFGIAGFGLHAVKRLMPGFALAQNARVTALSRRHMEDARRSADEFDIPLAFDSVEALCRSPEVDAVFVATPNASHLRDVLTAVRAGKAVLVEKPMAMNADECRQMMEAARSAGLLLGVAHVFRFGEFLPRIRSRIGAGEIGRVTLARAEFSYPGRGHQRKWLVDRAAGGGIIADVGVHCIDALRYTLADEIEAVGAQAISDEESGDVEAAAVLSLRFRKGALGAVLVSMRAEYRTPYEFVGETGTLRAHDAVTVEHPVTIELLRGGHVVDQQVINNQPAYARQVDAFAVSLETGVPFAAPGEEGWRNQLVLDAAYRSSQSGRTERIPQL
jgi:predicted dehydrogenase